MWLRQMGHDAYVLKDGVDAKLSHNAATSGKRSEPSTPNDAWAEAVLPKLPQVDIEQLRTLLEHTACELIDLRASMAYRRAHIPGSTWSIRPRLNPAQLDRPIVLIADEPLMARAAALDLDERPVRLLAGGFGAWSRAGYPTESSDTPTDAECIDYLFFTHDRHEGSRAAAEQYLAWEIDLVDSLDADERASFSIIPARDADG